MSIDDWRDENEYVWAVVKSAKVAVTKNKKEYLRLSLIGESGSESSCFVWGYNSAKFGKEPIPNYTLILSRFKKSDFGLSTFYKGIEVISMK